MTREEGTPAARNDNEDGWEVPQAAGPEGFEVTIAEAGLEQLRPERLSGVEAPTAGRCY